MAKVYEWPPVTAISREWTRIAPVSRSRSMITGAEFVSSSQRVRRVAHVEASSIFSPHGAGAGYMEALKQLLEGGINLVRLRWRPIYGDCDILPFWQRGSQDLGWIYPPEDIPWVYPPSPVPWVTVDPIPYAVSGSGVVVSGFPAGALIALPGEFVTMNTGAGQVQIMVTAPAYADDTGTATIKLVSQPPFGTSIVIGSFDEGVFAADAMPRAVKPASGDWSYTWSFTEVFEDEGRGPFEMVIGTWT